VGGVLSLVLLVSCQCATGVGHWWEASDTVLMVGAGDGQCSKSPDIAVHCCLTHDLAYARSPDRSEQSRFIADAELLACFAYSGVPEAVASTYYAAVRQYGQESWERHSTSASGSSSSADGSP